MASVVLIAVMALLAASSAVVVPVAYDVGSGDATMPDDALYGLERAGESIRMAVTTDQRDKANLQIELATERLDEAKNMAHDPERVDQLVAEYADTMEDALENARDLNDTDVYETVYNATIKHTAVLEELQGEVPSEAVPALEKATEVSVTGHEEATSHLSQEGRIP